MFEPLWNRNFIDYVEITGAEFLGVEERGGYYDNSGAVRDMFQNHLLQVLAMVGMEPPAQINADSMRDEVVKVLQCLKPLDEQALRNDLVLGQYTASDVRGQHLLGYREENGVADDSRTETYIGLKAYINNWRWNGVPFYVRTGKRLPTRVTEVVIHFKATPHPVFGQNAPENKLIIRIQPDEGIQMSFGLKEPGAGFKAKEVKMNFHYTSLEETQMLTAYERLLLDALNGDATLFARSDAVEACWQYVQPILDFKQDPQSLFGYACGTWGPKKQTICCNATTAHGVSLVKPNRYGLLRTMINHKIFDTAQQVVESLANDMKALSEQGRPVHISLSGGSTPKCCLSF